jgi:3'-phosphoadenosine 5'-phosphosulfate sulfotransferase (PAPS reductase)/FAD synthetase|tara:strand:+ start:167 stop:1000 length:834 start_codon:yes stop_codon:yes gene_type:complete
MSYELPSGNVLISFSGGRTSGFMLHEILQANGGLPDRCKVLFANTGREMPETLDFVHECGERWNVPITWLEYNRRDNKVTFDVVNHNSASRNGEPFESMLTSAKILPNVHRRFCTQELKVKTIKRYLVSQGWKNWVQAIGIRRDEARRVKVSKEKRWDNWYPLNDAGATKTEVMSFWRSQSFNLNLFGPNGVTPKGNCDGCFLKSEATLAMMWREHPDRMQWWADVETRRSKEIGKKCHFHETRTYTGLGEFVSKQGNFIFNDEAYLCQADDGECTD